MYRILIRAGFAKKKVRIFDNVPGGAELMLKKINKHNYKLFLMALDSLKCLIFK